MKKLFVSTLMLAATAACQQEADTAGATQRIILSEVRTETPPPPSPDTRAARWAVAKDGRAIQYGNEGMPPLLTLSCRLRENPPELRIVRYAATRPGQKSLFPVLGNGTISRFKLDAELSDGEWAWSGSVPARDPQLDVFTGPREIQATMPGGGTLKIAGSRLPGEFIDWCRAGGQAPKIASD